MNDQTVAVTLSLMQNILGYLGTRPYSEVFQFIQSMQEQVAPQVATPQAAAPQEE